MKAWTEDAIEQIATAQLLNTANTSTGERLALIICDNAIEYMMIAYTEMEKHLVHKVIKPAVWEPTKRAFHSLLAFTAGQEPRLATYQSDIQSYHGARNNLYHTGTPVTVKAAHVAKYLDIAKEVVGILFGEKLTEADWDKKVTTLNQALSRQAGKTIKASVTVVVKDGAVQVEMNATFALHEILCIVIDAFTSRFGMPPTQERLEKSLTLSRAGHLSGDNLSKRIYDARQRGLIKRTELVLTPKGHRLVAEKTVAQ